MASEKHKIAVTERQFLWVQNDDTGQIALHVGPTMVAPRFAERVVVDDGQGQFVTPEAQEPQRMIELSDAQYAVLHNPIQTTHDPTLLNGPFKPGRNDPEPLRYGERVMIPGPCSVYLRPGQRVEVRDAYALSSNHYLLVKVYGDVDQSSEFYDITARSAAITDATTDLDASAQALTALEPVTMSRGQLIVIRGLDAHFYIPPTGVDILPDLAIDGYGTVLDAAQAHKVLTRRSLETQTTPDPAPPEAKPAVAAPPPPPIQRRPQRPEPAKKPAPARDRKKHGATRKPSAPTLGPPQGAAQPTLSNALKALIATDLDALISAASDPARAVEVLCERCAREQETLQAQIKAQPTHEVRFELSAASRSLARMIPEAQRKLRRHNERKKRKAKKMKSFDFSDMSLQNAAPLDQLAQQNSIDAPQALLSLPDLAPARELGFVREDPAAMDWMSMEPASSAASFDEMPAEALSDDFDAYAEEEEDEDDDGDGESYTLFKQSRGGGRGRREGQMSDGLRATSSATPAPELQSGKWDEREKKERPKKRRIKGGKKSQRPAAAKSDAFGGVSGGFGIGSAPMPPAPMPLPPMSMPEPEPVALRGPTRAEVATAQLKELGESGVQKMLESAVHRRELERQARLERLIRSAVTLGEKDYCVLINADGQHQIKIGPARIFPGPYDRFMVRGSRARVYNAFELLPNRGLWLRIVREISRQRLASKLPQGTELTQSTYHPGDDLIISGANTFFFPFDEAEILDPNTGQSHHGNDHTEVFINAVVIQQHSGVYVRDLNTGGVRLIKGQQTYLIDPRREVRVHRTLTPLDWNLWIVTTTPALHTTAAVTTPWAIAVNVPTNHATLVISRQGQRIIEGPQVVLLEYDESLRSLSLSSGLPKGSGPAVETCLLKISGQRVRETLRIETRDLIAIDVTLSLIMRFDRAHRDQWFIHSDPIGELCRALGKLIRQAARQHTLFDFLERSSELLKAAVFGDNPSGQPSRVLCDNGASITSIALIDVQIIDGAVSEQLDQLRRSVVVRILSHQQRQAQTASEAYRHQISTQREMLQQQSLQTHAAQLQHIEALQHRQRLDQLRREDVLTQEALRLSTPRLDATEQQTRERALQRSDDVLKRQQNAAILRAQLQRLLHAEEAGHRAALERIDIEHQETLTRAYTAEHDAIPAAFVEALSVLGDRLTLNPAACEIGLPEILETDDLADLLRAWSEPSKY